MRRQLVVGNWKLHGNLNENEILLHEMVAQLKDIQSIDYGVCIPYPYLFQAQRILANTKLLWGAQNVSQFISGAYTSSVSANMIAEFGCALAIVGHSERRSYSHESNQMAVVRIKRAVEAGITPIYCVGETLAERELGQAQSIIKEQVQAIFELDRQTLLRVKAIGLVIAYEPAWAIGTGRAANTKQAQDAHAFIRGIIAEYDAAFAETVRVIYGGSLTPENARGLLAMPDIDGGLVGRCSISVSAFKEICEAAENTKTSGKGVEAVFTNKQTNKSILHNSDIACICLRMGIK